MPPVGRPKKPLVDGDSRHGTDNAYRNYGCRCKPCTRAHTEASRARRDGRVLAEGDPRHGTVNGYRNYRCRCEPCKKASREEYQRLARAGRLPRHRPKEEK